MVFLYGGHGVQDNYVYALCNSMELAGVFFPLEERLRRLVTESAEIAKSIYVLALLDCCREKMKVIKVKKEGESESQKA